jgi:hypothetical protein
LVAHIVIGDFLVKSGVCFYSGALADDEIYEPMVPSSEEDSGEEGSGMPAAPGNERITPVLVAGCSMAPDVNKSVPEPGAGRCGGIHDLAKRLHEDLCGARTQQLLSSIL